VLSSTKAARSLDSNGIDQREAWPSANKKMAITHSENEAERDNMEFEVVANSVSRARSREKVSIRP
jgi:hypothetical protein